VRQLGQQAVSKQVESNVMERDAMEHVISEMGIKAAEDGLTTAKVSVWHFPKGCLMHHHLVYVYQPVSFPGLHANFSAPLLHSSP
jgi:hypothetical protein